MPEKIGVVSLGIRQTAGHQLVIRLALIAGSFFLAYLVSVLVEYSIIRIYKNISWSNVSEFFPEGYRR